MDQQILDNILLEYQPIDFLNYLAKKLGKPVGLGVPKIGKLTNADIRFGIAELIEIPVRTKDEELGIYYLGIIKMEDAPGIRYEGKLPSNPTFGSGGSSLVSDKYSLAGFKDNTGVIRFYPDILLGWGVLTLNYD